MSEWTDKVRIVATAWEVLAENKDWEPIIKHFDLGFPYAWLEYTEMGTLNDQGKEQVENTYKFLLKALEVEDSPEYYSFWDMLAASNKDA